MPKLYNVSSVTELKGLDLPPEFLFAMLSYTIIPLCTFVLILVIILNNSLHQLIYLILLNLLINDQVGSSAIFISRIKELLLCSRTIRQVACEVSVIGLNYDSQIHL